ncbi:hypothetical protein EYF80_024528 [Liparis tanakae]|uniref:Uncharacterized protein n=1 Tax=Liparis tanakae TaxID=230148 RepID=A0A4Z2HH74_9TELE|nr:hypothetical protein EYF80_024528 [Liparis tanakae]
MNTHMVKLEMKAEEGRSTSKAASLVMGSWFHTELWTVHGVSVHLAFTRVTPAPAETNLTTLLQDEETGGRKSATSDPQLTETQARKPRNPPLRLPFTPLACLRASPKIPDYPTKLRKQSAARKTKVGQQAAEYGLVADDQNVLLPLQLHDHRLQAMDKVLGSSLHLHPLLRFKLQPIHGTQILSRGVWVSSDVQTIGSTHVSPGV